MAQNLVEKYKDRLRSQFADPPLLTLDQFRSEVLYLEGDHTIANHPKYFLRSCNDILEKIFRFLNDSPPLTGEAKKDLIIIVDQLGQRYKALACRTVLGNSLMDCEIVNRGDNPDLALQR